MIEEKILLPLLEKYFNTDISLLELPYEIKERVSVIRNMEILIYTNDHNPPHFHVKSNDKKVNAKFEIETGNYISGQINSTDLKRVKLFYNNVKTKIVMEMIWNKRNASN